MSDDLRGLGDRSAGARAQARVEAPSPVEGVALTAAARVVLDLPPSVVASEAELVARLMGMKRDWEREREAMREEVERLRAARPGESATSDAGAVSGYTVSAQGGTP